MQSFEWEFPTRVVFGLGRFQSSAKLLRGLGKRVFIVTSSSFKPGGARATVFDDLTNQLRKQSIEWQAFYEIEPNPRTTTIDRAAKEARDFNPRYILALGGGSVMDAAKCVALLCENPGEIYDYAYRGAEAVTGHSMRKFNHALPTVCIPTVAATSSETDFYAVVTQAEEKKKVTIFGESLQPKLAIIDPELTYSVPATQTVDGAFDMITHVMETYLSSTAPSPFTDNLSLAVVETVTQALPQVLENPKDAQARAQLSWCAAFALSGALSGRNGGWPIHALEHGLSAFTDVAHGRGLCFFLPRIMQFDLPKIPEKILRFNERIFQTKTKDPKESLEQGLFQYMKKVGAWTTLTDCGAPPQGPEQEKLVQNILKHTYEISAVWKKGEEPYLENIRPIYWKQAEEIIGQE